MSKVSGGYMTPEGVVDELEIALAPVMFGGGSRLFEHAREPVPRPEAT